MTKHMELEFGYNCKHFLPLFGKCRKLIDNYRTQDNLVMLKWLNSRELLVYLNASPEKLLKQIASDEIKTTVQADGTVSFGVSAAWKYDDCFLVGSGGGCLYFEKHNGKTISCLAQLEDSKGQHPNYKLAPSEAEVKTFEVAVTEIIELS